MKAACSIDAAQAQASVKADEDIIKAERNREKGRERERKSKTDWALRKAVSSLCSIILWERVGGSL